MDIGHLDTVDDMELTELLWLHLDDPLFLLLFTEMHSSVMTPAVYIEHFNVQLTIGSGLLSTRRWGVAWETSASARVHVEANVMGDSWHGKNTGAGVGDYLTLNWVKHLVKMFIYADSVHNS